MPEELIASTYLPRAAGIYMIHSNDGADQYIGSTVNFHSRYRCHLSAMRNGHWAYALKGAMERHGALMFTPLIVCEAADLEAREGEAVEKYRPNLNVIKTYHRAIAARGVAAQAAMFAREFAAVSRAG